MSEDAIVPETGPDASGSAHQAPEAALPERLGRYRITARVSAGGFGVVYHGHDDELRRAVAIKVPHRHRIASPADVEAYLNEARALARLDHPGIVPVYDVGRTDDGLCYVVSKFVEGSDLAALLARGKPPLTSAVDLVIRVAEALHHAHQYGFVHRDVKPANLLLDKHGNPIVADFGLALRDEDFGHGPTFAGTPAYMSPEQARGEGHRVDARTDVYNLGVVFYELLTGQRPYRETDTLALIDLILTQEPRPPRQFDDQIPRELNRICLKCLAKRATDRYSTARDLAEDLRLWQKRTVEASASSVPLVAAAASPVASPTAGATPTGAPSSDHQLVRIVPKGLRPFDAQDADFFLELLPGPRDRAGLPEAIRFWKARLEQTDPDNTFPVGLIYGPSGCGKSSLVKAGLFPRLAKHVTAVYVEATPEDTEARLLKALCLRGATTSSDQDLANSLAGLRRSRAAAGKVALVLDQFEQWLHAHRQEEDTALVRALRHCDGVRVQAVVLVRDDFWMAATRFMRNLEIRLVEGHNSAAVDLFDPRHARKVLTAFGRAFGTLPDGEPTAEEARFLDEAVAGLAQDGKVISVRLALFAEMVKGRPWTPATLKALGGTEGVGAAFLEETFAAPTAAPAHRLHQKAARQVLQALLPERGTDIKGHSRSREELLRASGYGARSRDFDDLLHILDAELRLVTPTDPEEASGGREPPVESASTGGSRPRSPPGIQQGADTPRSPGRYYQLTHDYLVPALRDWLTRKQRETRRGRAELRLAERAALWNTKREHRHLPAWWEWLNIRLLTRPRAWTGPQRHMMQRATRFHALRAGIAVLVLLLLGGAGVEGWGRLRAEGRVHNLLTAEIGDVPRIVTELGPYRRWADPLLRQRLADPEALPKERLHASLALAPVDAGQVDFLAERLLAAEPDQVPVLRDFLWPQAPELHDRLWTLLRDPRGDPDQRLRAACALALFDPDNSAWKDVSGDLVQKLATENELVLGKWAEALRSVAPTLMPPLMERLVEADAGGYAAFRVLAWAYAAEAIDSLRKITQQALPGSLKTADRVKLFRRQAQAAVALVQLGQAEAVWPLLRNSEDPTRRTFLIHQLAPLRTDPGVLAKRLREEDNLSARRGLILCLGEFALEQWTVGVRDELTGRLLRWYRDDPDPGIHSAVEWLLRQRWSQGEALQRIDADLVSSTTRAPRRWYVTKQGFTMAVIAEPGEVWMGRQAEDEEPQGGDERKHKVRIGRTFAVATKEVTRAQFKRFGQEKNFVRQYSPDEDCPINGVTWYEAAAYCNWLSQLEGLAETEWCYVPNKSGKYAEGMHMAPGYLQRSGYRLPTEAEWEHACRAGAATAWAIGASEDMLHRYGWYILNAKSTMHAGGQLKPNDFGLFDLHGNAWECCHDIFADYAATEPVADQDNDQDINNILNNYNRVLRGGSFEGHALNDRSALRYLCLPDHVLPAGGFRPARTYR